MNEKSIWKIALDCLMIVLLPLLMAYSLIGEKAHEWLGAVMFLLFLGHHALNWRWYRGLPKGKWTARRLFQTAVNIALLLCMLRLMVSGVMISRYVFSFFAHQRGAPLCPDAAYVDCLLGILPDEPAFGDALEYGPGHGAKRHKEAVDSANMVFSGGCCCDCRIWPVRLLST